MRIERLVVAASLVALLAGVLACVGAPADARAAAKPARTASERIDCQGTVTAARARKLPARYRRQLRRLGAYRLPARRAHRGVKARPARWICLRSAAQHRALGRLTRDLGARSTARGAFERQVVEFPRSLDRSLGIELPRGMSAGWRMRGVRAIAAQPFARGALYSTGEFDVVQELGVGSLKESIVVHRRQGRRTWSWELEWDGGRAPRLQADGSVEYGFHVRIAPPFVTNASGRRIRDLRWKLSGSVLSLTVDDRRLPLPYVIDPASSYPQRIHPHPNLTTGSSVLQSLASPPLAGPTDYSTKVVAELGDVLFWSGNTLGHRPGGNVSGWITDVSAPAPQNLNGISHCSAATNCNGALGWAQDSFGGTTLNAGPYTAQAVVRWSSPGFTGPQPTAALLARLWRVRLDSGDTDIAAATPITGWGRSTTATWSGATSSRTLSMTLTPLSTAARSIAPDERIYVEYGLDVTSAGRLDAVLEIATNNANTFVDFGGAASNTPGTAGNLRVASAPLSPAGWTTDSTPTLRADLDDPDWLHHLRFEVCADSTCTSVLQNGTSPANQAIGSTTDSWMASTLADGTYYVRARTEEDGGDAQVGAWTTTTGTTCVAVGVGPCGSFGVDTTLPSASFTSPAGSLLQGSVSLGGTASDATSGVASHAVSWTRTSPTAAGPATTGISCAGASSPTWGCTWNTASVLDGTYDVTVTVTDGAGNARTVTRTVTVDNTAPTWPGPAATRDGATSPSDVDWTTSAAVLAANWDAATDNSGSVAGYEYCFSTLPACGGTVVSAWTSAGTLLTATATGLGLAEGSTYYACVRASDAAGNVGLVLCSDGQTVDSTLPLPPTSVDDGLAGDVDWTTSTSSLAAHWSGGGDGTGSGVDRWETCIATTATCSGTIVLPWTSTGLVTSRTSAPLMLVEGEEYVTCVRVVDVAGNASASATCSDGQRVDSIAPGAPGTVADGAGADVDVIGSASSFTANWSAVADPTPGVGVASGLARYEYCITTSPTGADCAGAAIVPFTANTPATSTTVTHTGLTLADGQPYYACVRASDLAGNVSIAVACSDGAQLDSQPPTATWTSWSDNSDYLHGTTGPVLWFNPAAPLEPGAVATATVTATDAGGMDRVDFPNLAAGAAWGAGGSDSSVGAGDTWSHDYTFTGGGAIATPAPNHATAWDAGGSSTGSPDLDFEIRPDSTPPSGGSMPAMSGLQSTTTYTQVVPLGSDAQSGVARWVMDRQFAPLVDGTCGTWDAWIPGSGSLTGVAVNGTTVTLTHYLNDVPPFDGVPDWHDSFCFRTLVHVYDNVGNETTLGPNGHIEVDHADPELAMATPTDGSGQTGTVAVAGTVDDHWAGGGIEYTDTGSGMDRVTVTFTGPSSGTACGPVTAFGGAWTSHSWSCDWDTTALVDGTYTVTAVGRDRSGRTSTPVSHTVVVDNHAPSFAFVSLDDNGSTAMHVAGAVAWVNPNAIVAPPGTYQLDAHFTASDGGSGMDRVELPALGTGWSPGSASSATWSAPDAYVQRFEFTDPALLDEPGVQQATAYDLASNSTTAQFEVRLDGAAPTGTAANVTDGRQGTASVAVALTAGSDGASGSGLASWTLEYETASLDDDSCGSWSGSWTSAATGTGAAPASVAHDVVADGVGSACYRYRLRTYDNVGNGSTSATSSGARRVDLDAPTVATVAPTSASSLSGDVPVDGTVADAHSGIASVAVTWTGPASTSGTICASATLSGTPPSLTWACPDWATAPLTDGPYSIEVVATDRAGHATTTTTSVLLDNHPPYVAFHSFVETSPYTWWSGSVGVDDRIWFNPGAPSGSYSFDVQVTSSDLGTGVDRVEFDGAGTGWTPGSSAASQATPVGPADRYAQTYSFDTSVPGLADPGSLDATAFDPAGNPNAVAFRIAADADAPVGATVDSPDGFVASTSVAVAIDTGSDGSGSGIASWQLLRADGTLTGASCGSWTSYATVVASGTTATTASQADVVADPGCARYRLEVTDHVGNVATVDATQEVRVDLAPPVAAITLAEGTNPQWQYLDFAQRLFVNTNAGHSGTFDASVTASAASGILDVDFPALGAGITGDATVPGPGPYATSYAWSAGATPAASPSAVVRSNSLASTALPFEVIADTAAPTGATVSHPSGYVSSALSITYATGSDGTGSGIADWQLERELGTLAAGTCTWSGTWAAVGAPSGPLTIADPYVISHAECVRYRLQVTDNVGNTATTTPTAPAMRDDTAPSGSWHEYVGVGTATGTFEAPGGELFFRPDLGSPGTPAAFAVRVHVVDPESGPGTVTWNPAWLGTNWTFGATTPLADGAERSLERWATSGAPPGATEVATVANAAGRTAPYVLPAVIADAGVSSEPSWTIDYAHGYSSTGSVALAWTRDETDDQSGFVGWELLRREYGYDSVTGLCLQAGMVETSLGTPAGTSTTDATVTNGHCYRYVIRIEDAVGNTAEIVDAGGASPALFDTAWTRWSEATVAEVADVWPPAAFSVTLPTNPALPAVTTGAPAPSCASTPTYASATPTLAWSASSDAQTGLASYDVHLDGSVTPSTSTGPATTSWAPGTLAEGLHSVGVRAFDVAGNSTDAGPAFPSTFRVDTAAPTAALAGPATGTWTSDSTPTFSWTAADSNCLARVEVYVDDMTTPVAVASGTETSWTPAAPIADGTHTWRVEAVDAVGGRTSSSSATIGIDTTSPAAFALTAPTPAQTVRGFVDVAWTASSDTGSGLATPTAYEVWVDGAVSTAVGSGVTTATVGSLTNGPHVLFVRATDAVGNVRDTASVTITAYGPIPAPVLLSPADGAFLNAVPTLDWNWPSDGGPAPTDYDVLLDGAVEATTTHPTSLHALADPGDGQYDWAIEQHDPYTGTVTSATWSFVLDRTAPVNPGPITRIGTVASWPVPTDPSAPVASGIDHLEFVVDDGVLPPTTTTLAAGTGSYDFGTLPDGNYSVTLRAFDHAGNVTTTAPLSFTNDTTPPTAFALDAPAALPALPAITDGSSAPSCEATPTWLTATPTYSWQASSDATSGLAGYDVFVDGLLVGSTLPGTTTLVAPSPLTAGAHTWFVVARDNFGLARTSTPASMSVRVDLAAPTAALGSPAAGAGVADATPTLTWSVGDDSCAARVELTVDGAVVGTFAASVASWTPASNLAEGAHTWSLRAFDSAGQTVTTATRSFTVDTIGPTGVAATFPADGASEPEGMTTFDWTAGSDAGSGIASYDLIVDGTPRASGLTATASGTYAIYAGAHTWSIRAYDAVGNWTDFPFTFTATSAADVTAPDAFDLATPADGASIAAGDALTWQPSWDFHGVTQYRVYVDGALAGTTAGTDTDFEPSGGAALCSNDFDPPTAGCFGSPSYANGATGGSYPSVTTLGSAAADWGVASYAGWGTSGGAMGTGDPTVTPITSAAAGYDRDRSWTAVEYETHIPAGGGDIRFEHRYRFHMEGTSAYDGGTVEIMVDEGHDGFGNDAWESTCTYGASADYGVGFECDHEVVEPDGGFNVGFSSFAGNPLAHRNGFSGTSGGTVQTRMRMTEFAGMDVRVRFVIGMDGCYTTMPALEKQYCPDSANIAPAVWYIDELTLSEPELAPGAHSWYVVAEDAAGNTRQSSQTWNFTLTP